MVRSTYDMRRIVDLHIHSYFSDGTMSPVEIIEEALRKGVSVIAITDHENIEGSKALLELAKNKDIQCISGVELEAVENDMNFHILAYGIDLEDEEFNSKILKNSELLEEVNIKLISKMEKENPNISYDEYLKFTYNKNLGGWKALHYFVHKGIADSLFGGYLLYAQYNHSYTCVKFPEISELCQWIHKAGGKAILAHPGKVIKERDSNLFYKKLMKLVDLGLDGIECYYPSHSQEITNICLSICKERNLIVTSGSDCHGSFEKTVIGQMDTTIEQVNIDKLLVDHPFCHCMKDDIL